MNIPFARESANQDVHQGRLTGRVDTSPPAMCSLYNVAASSSGASIEQATKVLCTGVRGFQLQRTCADKVLGLVDYPQEDLKNEVPKFLICTFFFFFF